MAALLIIIAIPIITGAFSKSKLRAFFLATPLGVGVLWVNMFQLESSAPDSDLDIVFRNYLFVFGVRSHMYLCRVILGLAWPARALASLLP